MLVSRVEALADHQYALQIRCINPYPIVADGEDDLVFSGICRDVDSRRDISPELQGVGYKLLKQRRNLEPVDGQRRKRVPSNLGLVVIDRGLQPGGCLVEESTAIGRAGTATACPDRE